MEIDDSVWKSTKQMETLNGQSQKTTQKVAWIDPSIHGWEWNKFVKYWWKAYDA